MGEKVVFFGSSPEQVRWGNNDDPEDVLTVGNTYEIETTDVHSWHTKLKLKGIDGQYNSVCFETIEEENDCE